MATEPAGRYQTLDIIRGVAVMGIFSVNVIAFAMIEAAYFNPAAYGGWHGADLAVWAANMVVIDSKMRSLFSMLFGASMLLVVERAEAAGRSGWWTHARRMIVLLGFGLIHYYLIWFGDILTLYALAGLVAFWFRRFETPAIVVIGIGFILFHMALFSAIVTYMQGVDVAAHAPGASQAAITEWNGGFGAFYPSREMLDKDLLLHRSGFVALTRHSLEHWQSIFPATLLFLPDTVGLMLLGMAAFRSGFFTGSWSDERYRRIAIGGLVVGLVGFAAVVTVDLATNFHVIALFAAFVIAATPFAVAMAFGYAALIILLSRSMGWFAQRLAAVGRAAFTNYLGTSLIATFIFYGWGMGLYGRLSRSEAWLLVPIVWLLMLAWSKPWLERFNYGPLEWAWRSLSRGALQPMRKTRPQPQPA